MKSKFSQHRYRRPAEEIIGRPDEILNKFLIDPEEFSWVVNKIINEGPPPKQIRSAILLKELSKMVKQLSILTGNTPELISGIEIESNDPEDGDYTYPVPFPDEVIADYKNNDEIMEFINHGPAHDVLRDILMIAIIKWIQKVINNIKLDNYEK